MSCGGGTCVQGVGRSQALRGLTDMLDIERACIVQYRAVVGQETH